MKRAALRRELRRQRRELLARLARVRQEARKRVEASPVVRQVRRRRRWRRGLTLAVLVLLLSLLRCECDAPAPAVAVPRSLDAGVRLGPPRAERVSTPRVRTERQPRGAFQPGAPSPAGWLEAFRLQVAARAPRLAECFTGADRPGALRWSAALHLGSGAVTDHSFEALGADPAPSRVQGQCLERVLSEPPYALELSDEEDDAASAQRVGMVIEF